MYHEVAAEANFMTVYIADEHAHVQRLVLVFYMATVLEECILKSSVLLFVFLWQKDPMQRIVIKKCFLFTVGNVCHVKRFTTGSSNVADFSLMTKRLKQRCRSG
jgi:lipid-A-disaccharide synthase-like uncharacterized protein